MSRKPERAAAWRHRSLWLLGSLILLSCGAVSAEAEVTQEQRAEVGRLLQAYQSNLDRLRSGVVVISGDRMKDNRTGEYHGEIRAFMAFDHDRELLRYDYYEPGRTSKNKPTLHGLGGGAIWTPMLTAYREQGNDPLIQVHEAGLDVEKTPVGRHMLNLKVIGFLADPDLIHVNIDLERAQAHELGLENVVEYREEGDLVIVTWKTARSKRIVTFAKSAGGCPVACESFTGVKETPLASSTTVWELKSGVWAPRRVDCKKSNHSGDSAIALNLVWESVNQIKDESVFSPDSLQQGNRSAMIDDRSGTPVVVAMPSVPKPAVVGSDESFLRWAILLVSLVPLILVAAFFLGRKRKQ